MDPVDPDSDPLHCKIYKQAYLGSHVVWRSTTRCELSAVDFGGETKVANLDVDAVVDEDVARFEVPVDDVVLMQVLAPQQDLTKGQ